MSKHSIDKIEQQISNMSNDEWQKFAAKVGKDLEVAKLKARLKNLQPSSKDIIDELSY